MDESIARGLARSHIRRCLAQNAASQDLAAAAIYDLGQRLANGRVVPNPVAAMQTWRNAMTKLGGTIIPCGQFRCAGAVWPSWIAQVMDRAVSTFDGEMLSEKVDEVFHELTIMVDTLWIDRKDMITFSGVAALAADQHALHRWLQRQTGATPESFERNMISILPAATMQAFASRGVSDHSVPACLPFGDGLLIGYTVRRFSKELEIESPFGSLRKIHSGRPIELEDAVVVGAGCQGKIGGHVFVGTTYFGPRQMKSPHWEIRRQLLEWMAEYKVGLDFIAMSAFTNSSVFCNKRQQEAVNALARINGTQLWSEAIIDRGSRSIGRKLVAQVRAAENLTAQTCP